MSRLTTDKPNGMYELAHNSCYFGDDGAVRYRDFETDIDARELARDLMVNVGLWEIDDNAVLSDEIFDDEIMENLMHGPKETEGLIALFYRNLWAMADLRERLKRYEDAEENSMKIPKKLYNPCDDCQYGKSKQNQELSICNVCEFKMYLNTGLTPEVCMNFKLFEDECIRDGVQFKDILTLKDIVKGMTCETCRDHGKCAIEDNFNIKYCSDWEKKDEV